MAKQANKTRDNRQKNVVIISPDGKRTLHKSKHIECPSLGVFNGKLAIGLKTKINRDNRWLEKVGCLAPATKKDYYTIAMKTNMPDSMIAMLAGKKLLSQQEIQDFDAWVFSWCAESPKNRKLLAGKYRRRGVLVRGRCFAPDTAIPA